MTKAARLLGARGGKQRTGDTSPGKGGYGNGGGSANWPNPYGQGGFGGGQGFNQYGVYSRDPFGRGGVISPMVAQTYTKEGVASAIGERD
jgi:hypothetical protein